MSLIAYPEPETQQPGTRSIHLRRVRRESLLAVLSAAILALPGCQSVTGSPNLSQIRIVDTSPDAGGLDVYQGTGALAYNLGLGTITSYVPTTPGSYGINVNNAGTHQQVVTASGTFVTGAQYTVLIGNYSNTLQEIILKDQSQPAPSGQFSVRIIDQSTRAGAVDLYLVPTGSTITQVHPILTNVIFSQNTGYMNIATGAYTLIAVPTGTIPTTASGTSYTGSAVTYSSGTARTIVLIDQQLGTTPGLQVIFANDFDPVGATS
jgi:hypothetical protein